jgi:hypothetical protein
MARPIRRAFCWVPLLVVLLASVSSAEMVTRRWGTPPSGPPSAPVKAPRAEPPTCYVGAVATPPKMDGNLDEEAWKQAPVYYLAQMLDGAGRAPESTEVRLLRDDKMLYLALRCTEPLLARLQASRRSHDGAIWDDDSVEFFLGVGGAYYHFGVNALGSTYDGKAKDASWNSGFQAAVGREPGAWTAEAAVPLAKLAGPGAAPTEWTANFNRNRHATGTWQESAWSPTFSGESHVPDRFGKMLFRSPPAPSPAEKPERPVVRKKALTVLPAQGGEGVIRFDLSDLPRGATVYRADLLIAQTARLDGRMDEVLVDIQIFPFSDQFAVRADFSGKPLPLRPPWYDRFDATEAVRQWASGKPGGGFFVKACPFWNAEATCLDVWYEGKPEKLPPQVAGLEVFHRAGQTFITWKEIDDPVGKDEVAWGELKRLIDGLDQKRQVRYGVYRHDKPITAGNIHQAELIALVKPLSGWNIDGRNIDRPIDRVIATSDVLFHGHWNPFGSATTDGDYGRDCLIDRLVVRDGEKPLPRGTGLYVHTAAKKESAYYAVVACVDGVENAAEFSKANALTEPVAEAPAPPEPVLQGELPPSPLFNYEQKRLHYVQWVAPPLANVPYQYHNWSVGVPNGLGQGVPLELSLHRDGHSYWRTQYRIERDSIVLSPYDFPIVSWWYGYHESCGTLRSFKQGCIQPYTERRLLAFIEWASRKWPVDRHRILVTGCRGGAAGSGALHLGIGHPEVFNLVIAGHPTIDYAAASRNTDRRGLAQALAMQAVWGKAEWNTKTDDGESFWDQHDMIRLVESLAPTADLPLVTMTSENGYADCRRFYERMLARHAGIMVDFEWGGARYVPVSATGTYPNVIRLDVRKGKSLLAFTTAQAVKRVTQGEMGSFNCNLRWRDVVDEPDRYEVTLFTQGRGDNVADVVPRRLQKFKVEKGRAYSWKNTNADGKTPAQGGEATVGDDGLLVLKDVTFTSEGSRLVITPK